MTSFDGTRGPRVQSIDPTMTLIAARRPRYAALALIGLLEGCIVVPRTTSSYDRDCQVVSKHVELEPVQIAALGGCSNAGCAALLAFAGVTAAASAAISGSIAVVGNVVYWMEKQGQCARASTDPPIAISASASSQ